MISRLSLPLIVLFLAVTSLAQAGPEWIRLGAGGGEIEVSGPPNGLVLHEEEISRVALDLTDAWFVISADKRPIARDSIKDIKANKKDRVTVETKKFDGGNLLKIQTYDWEKSYSVVVNFAGDKYAYRISAAAATKDNESLRRFLGSIRISGQIVFPDIASASPAAVGEVLPIEKLRINQIVFDSLKKPNASPSEAKFAKVEDSNGDFDAGYTRRLFLVRKPKASYTDEARRNGKQGTIRTKVEFRSDGTIGAVTIDPSVDRSLAREVAKAISVIKFVPAEKDGAPVTIVKVVSYTFNIY
jgi:TonB family protein